MSGDASTAGLRARLQQVPWLVYALLAVAVAGIVLAIYAVMQVEPTDRAAVLTVAGATVGAVAMAISIHLDHGREYDERQLLIRYRAGYIAFFALFWFLLPLAMGAVDNEAAAHEIPLSADEVVFVAYGFGFLNFAVAFLYYRRRL